MVAPQACFEIELHENGVAAVYYNCSGEPKQAGGAAWKKCCDLIPTPRFGRSFSSSLAHSRRRCSSATEMRRLSIYLYL